MLFIQMRFKTAISVLFILSILLISFSAFAQSSGTAGSIDGKVADSTGAVVTGAQVTLQHPASGYRQATTTDGLGLFHFRNVPFSSYHLSVTASGFAPQAQDVDVRSAVPVTPQISLSVAGGSTTEADLRSNWNGR